jgi:hypothetical protein
MDPNTIAAIVPCKDEALSIGELVSGLRGLGIGTVVVSIDAANSDTTAAKATAAGAVVVQSGRSGYDGPVLAGIEAAVEPNGTPVPPTWLLFLDAGNKYHLESIGNLIRTADPSTPLTFGVRDHQLFWHQRIGNLVFAAILWARFGQHRCKDVSSVRLIRAEVIDQLQYEDRQFSLPFQTVVHALKQGLHIDYIPIRCQQHRTGSSKVSGTPRNSARAAREMLLAIKKAPRFSSIDQPRRDA